MRTLLKLVIVLVLLGVAGLSTLYATDPLMIPLEVDIVWMILGGAIALGFVAALALLLTREQHRKTRVIASALPYANATEPAFAQRPLGAPPELPPGYMPAPPRVAAPPPFVPGPLLDDGPTTADPTLGSRAEDHYAQYRRRLARGSERDLEGVTERAMPPPAIRANTLQARPVRAAMRSRNAK